MVPLEVWQAVLGFCPFEEYARLVGLRPGSQENCFLEWHSLPASREFYHLLKHSQLEMRFDYMLPSPCMGGLWLASRVPAAGSFIRSLRLGLALTSLVTLFCPFLTQIAPQRTCPCVPLGCWM